MDYLFAQMMLIQKKEGFRTFNFAVAPFVGIGDRPNATLTEKAVNQIFERLDWFLHSKASNSTSLNSNLNGAMFTLPIRAVLSVCYGCIEREPYPVTNTVGAPPVKTANYPFNLVKINGQKLLHR